MFPHALQSVRQTWAKVTGKFKRDAVNSMKLLLCYVAVDEIRGANTDSSALIRVFPEQV